MTTFIEMVSGDREVVFVNIDRIETIKSYHASYEGSKINFRQDDAPLYVRHTPTDIFRLLNPGKTETLNEQHA